MSENKVGAGILNIITESLYDNPIVVFREYVQNSVDSFLKSRENTEKFKAWFKVVSFEAAPKNIMSQCCVASSGTPLGEVSKHSMSPYFIIEYTEDKEMSV